MVALLPSSLLCDSSVKAYRDPNKFGDPWSEKHWLRQENVKRDLSLTLELNVTISIGFIVCCLIIMLCSKKSIMS